MSDTQHRKEECRGEVRGYLANRSVLAYRAETIQKALRREFDFTLEEINAALTFLRGQGHVSAEPDPDGATPYFKVTSEGILFYERNP
jgi:hypothetical protein